MNPFRAVEDQTQTLCPEELCECLINHNPQIETTGRSTQLFWSNTSFNGESLARNDESKSAWVKAKYFNPSACTGRTGIEVSCLTPRSILSRKWRTTVDDIVRVLACLSAPEERIGHSYDHSKAKPINFRCVCNSFFVRLRSVEVRRRCCSQQTTIGTAAVRNHVSMSRTAWSLNVCNCCSPTTNSL